MSDSMHEHEVLLRYVAGDVTEAEQLRVDTHLAKCDSCVEHVRTLRYLQTHFSSIWDSWTAAEHGRLCRQLKWLGLMRQVIERTPTLSARLRHLGTAIREELGLAFQLLIDQSRKLATAGSGGLPADYEFVLCPAYRGVGSADEQQQLENHLPKKLECLANNRTDEAVRELMEAVKIDPRRPQSATLEILRKGRRVLQAAIDGRAGRAWVRYWPAPDEPVPILAVLIDCRCNVVQAAAFERVSESSYLLAEFPDIPDGSYTLRIGPFAPGTTQ